MRIALVTDAWAPQVNGVVRTLTATVGELTPARPHRRGDRARPVPLRAVPDLSRDPPGAGRGPEVGLRLQRFAPDAVHIATEGPLGLAARR